MDNNLTNKSENSLQMDSFDVTVVKDPKMRPFLNVFHVTGQNIQQQKLGKIFGIIQVDDTSKGSAYLPNMLTQIIKKEYFKNKNNDCGKSFEIALHKINLALTELTQHEIVKWMGNLNAAIGVVCGNEIHFTQIGQGRILFIKNKKILTIGNDSNKTEDYHPMKTFSSISAGKIGNGNKLIFTLKKTFETLKENELERHLKTFNSNEFDNIISSTLRNEASNTGMVTVNIKNQIKPEPELLIESDFAPETVETDLNFFGKTKPEKKEKKIEEKIPERIEELSENPIKTEDPNKSPFENEPEIFFKEKDEAELEELEKNKDKKTEKLKINLTKIFENSKLFIKNKILTKSFSFKNMPIKRIAIDSSLKIKGLVNEIDKKKILKIRNWLIILIQKIDFKKIKRIDLKLNKKLNWFKIWLISLLKNKNTQKLVNKIRIKTNFEPKEVATTEIKAKNKIFEKIKNYYFEIKIKFAELSKKESSKKIFLISLISIVALTSFFFIIKKMKPNNEKIIQNNKNNQQTNTSKPKNSNIQDLKILINFEKGIKDSVFFKNDLFLLTDDKTLIKYSIRDNTKTEIVLPVELKNPRYLSSIKSLQIVLIIGRDDTYSYSPVTNSFSKNIIQMPKKFEGAGTYLTYLYLLDQNSNQIYRYHRAPGGFGIPINWIKEEVSFQDAIGISVSDSIYVTFNDGKIQKYFRGRKEKEFNLGEDFTPNEIQTEMNRNELFALDKKQGKIMKLSENDSQQILFQDDQFKNAKDFSVDFENKNLFIITKKEKLLMFTYQ